jgi:hypothetical protein
MCEACYDPVERTKAVKEMRMYALPVVYPKPMLQDSKPISRRLSRPRRCKSHALKRAERLLFHIFGRPDRS